jgi:Major Facilitator Superfamily
MSPTARDIALDHHDAFVEAVPYEAFPQRRHGVRFADADGSVIERLSPRPVSRLVANAPGRLAAGRAPAQVLSPPDPSSPIRFTSPDIDRWRAFALLAVSSVMTVIDLTIVNVSLPTIGRNRHFSQTNLPWVVTAYSLTFGGFLLLGGRAADLLGRLRSLMIGLALFSAASLACALARSDRFLIAMRAAQGLGHAGARPR